MEQVRSLNQTIIILDPGEEIVIRAAQPPTPSPQPPITDPDGRKVLPIPWISQWGPTANRSPGDCGPACLAMVIHYLTTHEPTVNEVAEACGQRKGSHYSDFDQLARGARVYDVSAQYIRPLKRQRVEAEIDAGRPALALVKYSLLPGNQDDYTGPHFVLVVGYSSETAIFHDPDRLHGDEFGEFREVPWTTFLKALSTPAKPNKHASHGMTFDV